MIDKFPPIFDICNCGDCNEIVWGGRKFINGHNNRGKTPSEETCQKISKTLTGTHRPQEVIDKISDSQSGAKSYWFGKKQSKESNKKRSESLNKYYLKNEFPESAKKKISIKNTGKISWLKGKNVSENTKKKISIANSGKNNGMYGRLQGCHGKRFYYESPLQGTISLRSSWEFAYVKYLDENKILWMYEMETFDLGDATYTPDFFLPATEQFIEIKGWMHKNSQERINKFLEQYPWNLKILRKNDLIKLGIEL